MTTLETTAPLRFGRFLLEPSRRQLCLDDEPVPLSSRAFDILALLAENRHRIVSKDEIFASVWRGVAVEDNNLAVQMSALRRALGEPAGDPKIILTIPGRGYRFIAPIADAEPAPPLAAPETVLALPEIAPARPRPRHAVWPAAVAALIALPVLAWLLLPQFRAPVAPRLSIVVLPFRNLSADPQQDYLADAISDDLTTDLSHIPGSVVIARESADVYKGKAVGAETIGRALHVRYLLEGSLMPEGQTLHVNAQLIDATNGTHLWASRFDVTKDKLGRTQSEIVSQIASALNFTLVQVEAIRSIRERSDNPDAVDLYLRARSILATSVTLATISQAQDLLERSIEKSPDFEDAFARLGIVLLGKIGGFDDPTEIADYDRAKVVVNRALTLGPGNPLAITASGMLNALNRDCRTAILAFQKAVSLDMSQVLAHKGLASCAWKLGNVQDMIDEISIIRQLDPASTRDPIREHQLGMGYLMLGRPHDAIVWLNRAGAGLVDAPGADTALGWQEWRQIYLIAATWLDGDKVKATRLCTDYKHVWPRRSVWQIASYDTHALASLPTNRAYRDALAGAGMPYFIDEMGNVGPQPGAAPVLGSDMDATPLSVAGAKFISANELHNMLEQRQAPVIVDYGRGSAVIPGAIWVWSDNLWEDANSITTKLISDPGIRDNQNIVMMGNGPLGWSSYNAASSFVAKGLRNVLWFRGGEEAWIAAGYGAEDRRSP